MPRCFLAALVLSSALLMSCAHFVPEARCDLIVDVEGPDDVGTTVARACQRFIDSTDATPSEVSQALLGTRAEVMEWREPPPCPDGSPACAHIKSSSARVYTSHDNWRRYLHHEIYHVLLARLEPDLPIHHHHSRMRELGLCGTTGACGGFHPMCRSPRGGFYECNSALR